MAKKKTADERVNIRISPDLKKRATKAAEKEGRSLSNFIIRLLEENC